MDEIAAVGDIEICRWFATVFARELSHDAVEACIAGAAAVFLDAIATRCAIEDARVSLENSISGWADMANPTAALRVEFGSLFLVPGRASATPYASFYDEKSLFGAAHDRMTTRLEAAGLSLAETVDGPADHLAVMLEYLAHLIRLDAPAETRIQFLTHDLIPLSLSVSTRIREHKVRSDFYREISSILTGYLNFLAYTETDQRLSASRLRP